MVRNPSGRLSCSRLDHHLHHYVDGAQETVTDVTDHLEECQRCADVVALYGAIKNALTRESDTDDAAVDRLTEFTRQLAISEDESEDGSTD